MKHSTPFTTGARSAGSTGAFGWLSTTAVTWRPDGYPAGLSPPSGQQYCAATTIGEGGAFYKAGRYVVLYDGNGTLELDGDAKWPPLVSFPGRLEVNVTPSTTGLRLRITSSSPSKPLTFIRIVPAAYLATHNTTQVFHPDFLAALQSIPLLRFAAWMRVSGDPNNPRNAPRSWAARTTPRHSSQVRDADGVAVEHLVQLANAVNASMWISMPRAANDSDPYVYGMMSYIAATLSPGLGVTLEYGTDGPGWISSHLPYSTEGVGRVARRAWAAAGRPRAALRVAATAPIINAVQNILYNLAPNFTSWLDAMALPASFGGMSYFTWGGRDNPTAWSDGAYFATSTPRPITTLERVLKLIRSSVIAADVSYNRQFRALRVKGLQVLGYAAGPELLGPLYGARANYDRVLGSCLPPPAATAWPCSVTTMYPPWAYSGGPSSTTWPDLAARNALLFGALAANASREAVLESVIRQARLHDSVYDMVLDSLWRWHGQMGGGDVVLDVTRLTRACRDAPGIRSVGYAPDECRNATRPPVEPAETPAYRALRAWLAAGPAAAASGGVGKLPRSAAEAPPAVPPAAACLPACVYGTCSYQGVCECWAGASGPACASLSSASTPSACNPRLGINLEGISDWSRSWTFVDVFKASREWIPQSFTAPSWSTGAPVPLINSSSTLWGPTALGYPAYLDTDVKVATLVERDLGGHAPAGVYTLLYDGKGSIEVGMGDVKNVEYVEAGHIRVNFTPSTDFNNGMLITIERTDPTDPLRNIRVLMPGYERAAAAGSPFHPALLEFLRPFGLIRFMDWMRTNTEALPVNWGDRPRVTDRSYAVSRGGVPLEHMVHLANTLGADPWFNIPHAATDDYIAQFATAVRDTLRPDLKVYVEYSNEVWHTGFPGGKYAQAMGLTMNLTQEGNRWYGGATNEARLCFAALRTANISRIWKAVWGAVGAADRVVAVVSGQAVWPITSSKLLSCFGAGAAIDALAIAPYFGSYDISRDTSLGIFMNTTLPGQIRGVLAQVGQHAAIAASYGKPLLTYESGQGLVGDGSSTDLAIQANRDPAMSGLYHTYLNGLTAANVSRVVHFISIGAYSRYGSWGLLEFQDADRWQAPKYQATISYIHSNLQCPLPPPPAPATCPGGQGGVACSGYGDCLRDGTCLCYAGSSGVDCSVVKYTEDYGGCGYKCTFDQGWCNVSSISGFTRAWGCTCKPGIIGRTCSVVSCPNNCSLNGECLDQGICACYPGFKGPDCSTDCGCGGHGRCADDGTNTCTCDVGWRAGPGGKCDQWECSNCDAGTSCIGPGECGCAEPCLYGTCFAGRCRCWAGYGGPACNVSDAYGAGTGTAGADYYVPRVNRGSLAGINLGGLSYWSTEWVWTDVMKGSSRWMTANAPDTSSENRWDTGVSLDLRPDGYPARLPPATIAHKLLLRNVQLHAWPGRYVVLYDGDGRLDFGFDAKVLSRSKGRLEILLSPTADLVCAATGAAYCGDNGIHLKLLATNPANPLRNIRIMPSADGPAASAGGAGGGGAWEGRVERAPFHPWFLRSIARYGVVRFMTWLNTNTNSSWTAVGGTAAAGDAWSRRTTPAHDTQAGEAGAALEHVVQLCNMVGADPWVTVHHLADDAYVAAMADLMARSLRPDVKVYVEHSNEVWNSLFPQHAHARSRGLALNLSTDPWVAAYRYHAARTVAIGEIFRAAFARVAPPGGGGSSSRVRVVLGGWGFLCGTNNSGCGAVVMRETLGWNGTAAKVDLYGITAYWDCGLGQNGPVDALLSIDQMVSKCTAALNSTRATATALAGAVASYGVPPIVYEAGPSIVEVSAISSGSVTPALTTKLVALSRDPRMYGLYGLYLDAFRSAGLVGDGRPWMQFVSTAMPSQYGSWGLQEYTGQSPASAPKYRALMDWLDQQRPAGQRPRCLALAAAGGPAAGVAGSAGGGLSLGEGLLLGPPAVQLPAAGQALVQGRSYTARWSTVGWPTGQSRVLEVTLWADSDCDASGAAQLPKEQALAVLLAGPAPSPAGELSWGVPTSPALTAVLAASASGAGRREARFFLRITDGLTTNYSEPFDIQPPTAYVTGPWSACDCAASPSPQQIRALSCHPSPAVASPSAPPDQAPPPSPPFCAVYPRWNTTLPNIPGDPVCSIDPVTGCRTYRTSNTGAWSYSVFKPVTDCTALYSPWPRSAATAASGGAAAAAAPLPLSACADAGLTAPPTSRACPPAELLSACGISAP